MAMAMALEARGAEGRPAAAVRRRVVAGGPADRPDRLPMVAPARAKTAPLEPQALAVAQARVARVAPPALRAPRAPEVKPAVRAPAAARVRAKTAARVQRA